MARRPSTSHLVQIGAAVVCLFAPSTSWSQTPAPIDLAAAPSERVVLVVAPGTLPVATPVCVVKGAGIAAIAGDAPGLALDAVAIGGPEVSLTVARPGQTCEQSPRTLAARFVPSAWSPPQVSAALHADGSVVEVAGKDLDGVAIAVHADGRALRVERCLGGDVCTLPLDVATTRRLLAGEARLGLHPADDVEPGAPLPSTWTAAKGWAPPSAREIPLPVSLTEPMVELREVLADRKAVSIPLSWPEVVADVACQGARCAVSRRGLDVFDIAPDATSLQIDLTLKPDVTHRAARKQVWSTRVSVTRCAVRAPDDVPLLAGVREHAYVLAIDRACFTNRSEQVRVTTRPHTAVEVRSVQRGGEPLRGWRVVELVLDRVPEQASVLELEVRSVHDTLLGSVRLPIAQGYAPTRIQPWVEGLGAVPVVPSNRPATLKLGWTEARWARDIAVEARPGYYEVLDGTGPVLRAIPGPPLTVPLRMTYRPAGLEAFSGRRDVLAWLDSPAQVATRAIHVPVPLRAKGDGVSVARVLCAPEGKEVEVAPGRAMAIPWAARGSCRLIIDRTAIPPEAGEQRLRVKGPGVDQLLLVGHGEVPIVMALSAQGKREFDTILVSVGHDYSGGHYDLAPVADLGAEASWRVILGDSSVRVSAGTSLPTALFRFGDSDIRGSVPLSAGVLARLSFLDKEGEEFPVGIELGLLGTGLSSSPDLSIVAGVGLSLPVLNKDTVLQASFNVHIWVEMAPTREGTPWAFLFGPSFGVGKFSLNL